MCLPAASAPPTKKTPQPENRSNKKRKNQKQYVTTSVKTLKMIHIKNNSKQTKKTKYLDSSSVNPFPSGLVLLPLLTTPAPTTRASHVVLMVRNPPATAGDARDAGSIPGSRRIFWSRKWQPLQYSCLENCREAWRETAPWGRKESDRTERLSTPTHAASTDLLQFSP